MLVAERVLARLKARGIDYLLSNAGTDHAPLIEGLARMPETGLALPEAMIVPHEHVAVSMAHGAYLATGRPQAILVHVNVGLANALMGTINAARDNVPMVILSGRTPVTETARPGHRQLPIHWGQEMRDQAGMLREVVKWDYELRYGDEVDMTIDRAVAIAMSEPRGPVYLSLPREVLAEEMSDQMDPAPVMLPTAPSVPADGAIDEAVALISSAEHPVLFAARASDDRSAAALARLAEAVAIPVVEFWPSRNSMASSHPRHGGHDPADWLGSADLVIILDSMVPWLPWLHELPKGCKVIQIGPDPLFSPMPIRGFRADLALAGSTAPTLDRLADALEGKIDSERAAARGDAVLDQGKARRQRMDAWAKEGRTAPMSQAWASLCISRAVAETGADATIVSELACMPEHMSIERSGGYFSHSLAGGLGWGVPAALGIKLMEPERLVIAATGDGSFLFTNPVVCHQLAAGGLPIVMVVFKNGVWNAVRKTTGMMYPEGAAMRANRTPLTSLDPQPDYVAVCKAAGGWAKRVEHGEDLPRALKRAIRAVTKEHRQALLEIITAA